ncbi:hypothetical protein [Paenibacillus sp. NPDC058071]|uniref:hypothetical protein n=1 Tax=Paenibacillus sp. NPDC058071 TaxID=3346326 RepID=UPI0036D8453C
MNRIPSVLKMHYRDKTSWFIVPGMVLGSSFAVNLLVGALGAIEIYTGGLMSIYIYMFVMGILVVPQTFPFAISFSVRRQDYYSGTALYAVTSGIVITLLLLLMSFLESDVTNNWGVDLHFFNLPYLSDGSIFQQFVIYLLVLLTTFFGGFTIGSFYRKFRNTGMLLLAIASVFAVTVLSYFMTKNDWWMDVYEWLIDHTAFQLALWLIPIILVCNLISFLFLRRSTV